MRAGDYSSAEEAGFWDGNREGQCPGSNRNSRRKCSLDRCWQHRAWSSGRDRWASWAKAAVTSGKAALVGRIPAYISASYAQMLCHGESIPGSGACAVADHLEFNPHLVSC